MPRSQGLLCARVCTSIRCSNLQGSHAFVSGPNNDSGTRDKQTWAVIGDAPVLGKFSV
jgi:hypothetical protein